MARMSALMAWSSNSRAIRNKPSITTGAMAKVASARHSLAVRRRRRAAGSRALPRRPEANRHCRRTVRQRRQPRFAEGHRGGQVALTKDQRDGDAEHRLEIHAHAVVVLER